jgi:glycosyltransferase involved in cell wall biosynthesis
MNILFICKTLPHEHVIGGPIIIYNRIRLLSERHEVSLLCFAEEGERRYYESVSRYCLDFKALPPALPPRGFARLWQFFSSPVPIYFLYGYSDQMYDALRKMVGRNSYDVIISEYSMVAQYLYRNPDLAGIKRVMSVHECYYLARKKAFKVQTFSREGLSALINMKGLKKFEFDMYADADKLLVLTPEGKQELLEIRGDLDIAVVPHGVDCDYFNSAKSILKETAVMFLGNYPHDPNRDAVTWFVRQVWPNVKSRAPEAKFYVVGKDPTPDIRAMAQEDSSIIVTGTVEDVRPYFERSRVFVNPVRIGGGFRGKLLEAMAMGLPIVTTSLGAEGVRAENGRDMILADDPASFADAVFRLLNDQDMCEALGERARTLACDLFSWQTGVDELERVLIELIGG